MEIREISGRVLEVLAFLAPMWSSSSDHKTLFSNQVTQWVPAENFIDPDGKVCEALKRWELSQQGDVLTEHLYDAALDDEVGPPSDPESDDGGSDFVADDVSDDDDE